MQLEHRQGTQDTAVVQLSYLPLICAPQVLSGACTCSKPCTNMSETGGPAQGKHSKTLVVQQRIESHIP